MILIRHGESHFNRAYRETRVDPGFVDPGLTADGRQQAATAALAIRRNGVPTSILVSPYRRTLETAQILADALRVPVTVEPLVRERAAFMCDIGTCPADLAPAWPGLGIERLEDCWWHGSPADGIEESEAALHVRCHEFRGIMAEREDWQRTLVVTHWGFIRGLTGRQVQNCQAVRFDPITGEHALQGDPA